ncbi:IS3-like element ISSpu6 family transposase [Shewanella profunda]|uniref:IS3-like element ISSpu6 family transposase n=1 Tax=Shewanella profunda TaxID=254793 RepID=UPI00200CAD4A|nr:IS3-like element ISSpu6 family transposase [Shewanella profunda]MCL1092093.1 IS3-like element ISSpu6 family transposase [Shewanella profunda]
MARYSPERKEAILKKLLPPHNLTVAEVAREEGIAVQTLYHWRDIARKEGRPVPGKTLTADDWSAEAKLAVIIETAPLSEAEINQYCREKGLFREQVQQWKQDCLAGFQTSEVQTKTIKQQAKADKAEIKSLQRELRYKEKALAEAAALLVLRKKPQCALGGRQRGELTPLPERIALIALIQEAYTNGARLYKACAETGLSKRTYRRWFREGQVQADLRPTAARPEPANKLEEHERQQILSVCNQAEYASLPPSQIVPTLLDNGIYIASESSFYRVLNAHGQLNHRGRTQAAVNRSKPLSYRADGPNQVWSWDITYLASIVKGQFYYLYLFEDIYSRKIVGYEVHEQESGEYAAALIQRCLLREQCFNTPLVLHSDNGAPMKSLTMKAKLEELGITASLSRPRVSNDNPFSESLFKTLKYRPQWPASGFSCLATAREWVEKFVIWYNDEHKHSQLNFVSPGQRHALQDGAILAKRKKVLEAAKERKPMRWSTEIRNCEAVGAVTLNPDKAPEEGVINAA